MAPIASRVQQALMPYEQLLPERFRGRNERIDEPLEDAEPSQVPTDASCRTSMAAARDAAPRKLKISILRYNPQEPGSAPRMQTYELEEADGMTLFIALNEIREKQDPSLQFDFVCRAGICGSCGDDDQRPARRSPAAR